MLAISTPDDDQNFFSALFELKKPDGENMFKTIRIGLSCASCLEAGLLCQHLVDKLPHCKKRKTCMFIRSYPNYALVLCGGVLYCVS